MWACVFREKTIVKDAQELVTIATTKQAGIVSFTRHLKRWLKSLRGVLIMEISERTNAIAAVKADIKKRFHNSKSEGRSRHFSDATASIGSYSCTTEELRHVP